VSPFAQRAYEKIRAQILHERVNPPDPHKFSVAYRMKVVDVAPFGMPSSLRGVIEDCYVGRFAYRPCMRCHKLIWTVPEVRTCARCQNSNRLIHGKPARLVGTAEE
jgi:hypothetical protein